jgi:hypothetical protein
MDNSFCNIQGREDVFFKITPHQRFALVYATPGFNV